MIMQHIECQGWQTGSRSMQSICLWREIQLYQAFVSIFMEIIYMKSVAVHDIQTISCDEPHCWDILWLFPEGEDQTRFNFRNVSSFGKISYISFELRKFHPNESMLSASE
jgi:hypothetical protein